MPTQTTALIVHGHKARRPLLILGFVLLALAAFVAWTAARPVALVYGMVGAAICFTFASILRPKAPKEPPA